MQQDVPHYGSVELEALSDEHIVEAARVNWAATELDPVDDPDWNNPVCKRIVQITDEAGKEIAADVRCDDYNLEYISDEQVTIREAAEAMLEALDAVDALIRKHGIGDIDAESEPVVAKIAAARALAGRQA